MSYDHITCVQSDPVIRYNISQNKLIFKYSNYISQQVQQSLGRTVTLYEESSCPWRCASSYVPVEGYHKPFGIYRQCRIAPSTWQQENSTLLALNELTNRCAIKILASNIDRNNTVHVTDRINTKCSALRVGSLAVWPEQQGYQRERDVL